MAEQILHGNGFKILQNAGINRHGSWRQSWSGCPGLLNSIRGRSDARSGHPSCCLLYILGNNGSNTPGQAATGGGLVCQTITQGHLVCGGKNIILLQPRARKKDLAVQSPIIVGFSVISKESAIVRKDPMPVPGPDGSSQNRGSHCQNTDPKNVPIKRPTSFRVSSPDQGKKQAAG